MRDSDVARSWLFGILFLAVVVLATGAILMSWQPALLSSPPVVTSTPAAASSPAVTSPQLSPETERGVTETVSTPDDSPETTTLRGTQTQTPAPQQPVVPADSTLILDINDQVATEDGTVTVRGIARGPNQVLVFFVDRRGGYASTILRVDDNDEFESDDVPLVTLRGEPMTEGIVVAGVFAAGRDGVVGDGEISGFARADLETFDESNRQQILARLTGRLTGPGLTQQQVLEILFAESVGEEGSDDLLVEDVFFLTDGRTTIETVTSTSAENATTAPSISPGDTMVVQGLTNRKPGDTTIFVEVVDGPSASLFEFASTDDWETDGMWSVSVQVPADIEEGTYTIRVDDGDDTDRVQVTIRATATTTAGEESAT